MEEKKALKLQKIEEKKRLKLEKKYSLISGIKLDAKIFFKTIIQVLKKEGAN